MEWRHLCAYLGPLSCELSWQSEGIFILLSIVLFFFFFLNASFTLFTLLFILIEVMSVLKKNY